MAAPDDFYLRYYQGHHGKWVTCKHGLTFSHTHVSLVFDEQSFAPAF